MLLFVTEDPKETKNPMPKDNLNLRDFLELALSTCMIFLKSKSGSIFLFDDKRQELVLKIARNSYNSGKRRRLEGIRENLGEGISGLAAFRRQPLLIRDAKRAPRLQNRLRFNHYRTNSFLSVPLMVGDKLIGVINMTDKADRKNFNAKDLQFISPFFNYIALTIDKISKAGALLENIEKPKDDEQSKSKKFASLGKLVAGIAHELNNPLDGVIRYANLSLECLPEEGIVREYLLEAKKGLNRITGIIKSLLNFAQTFSPVFDRPADVNKVIEDSLFMMGPYIQSRNIEVVKQLNQNLPNVCEGGLKLVFTNIIKNACDAMPKGGTLKVRTGKENGVIEIIFSDTGPGIPEKNRERIFEPFFTTKEMGKGSGLGLAISYDIIQRHNGKIFLENNGAKGAGFTIQLPVNGLKQHESK